MVLDDMKFPGSIVRVDFNEVIDTIVNAIKKGIKSYRIYKFSLGIDSGLGWNDIIEDNILYHVKKIIGSELYSKYIITKFPERNPKYAVVLAVFTITNVEYNTLIQNPMIFTLLTRIYTFIQTMIDSNIQISGRGGVVMTYDFKFD